MNRPKESYLPEVIKPKPSVIGLTIEAKLSDIQDELNASLGGLVYEDNSLDNNGGDNLMVKAWKQSDIRLAMNDNVLIYRVPLKIWIKAGFKKSAFGITLSDYRELEGALALMFRTEINLNTDWTISTQTESSGYEWISEPVVKVGGINIPVKFVADLILQGNLKVIGKSMDASIKQYLDMEPYAAQAWKSLNQPILLNDTYKIWLNIQSSALYASSPKSTVNRVKLNLGVKSVLETSVGQRPAANAPGPLPRLIVDDNLREGVNINSAIHIPFAEMNVEVRKYIVGQTFTQGKRSVKVENVTLYGSNGKLVAETQLSGSFKGTIYFSGVPAFNVADSTLYLKNFDFDVSTRNVLIKSVAWLFQGDFRSMMSGYMKWSLAGDIKQLINGLNTTLESYPLAQGIILKGEVSRFSVQDILIDQEGVHPFISADGKLNVVISTFIMKQ